LNVSEYKDIEGRAELQRVNEELAESLARCRFMLAEARAKLAANANEDEPLVELDQERSG
jgi:hypothetical protein